MKLVFATRNAGKLREARAILGPGVELVSAEEATLPEVDETGETFEENAILKARSACAAAGLPALADDSGLEVDALDKRPGVRSARYGGPGLDDRARCALLLRELASVPAEKRTARFVCAIALAEPGGRVRVTRGTVEGRIALTPSGDGGFGYDPLFIPDGFAESFGVLPEETKNRLSHRARALTAARAWLG
ncbi:MAG TPA: RdgB/HAM1 family non-canonical purine NTP pyrophosphatase [bacterium]|nr:RdgB/HAM1 family non-canonical purine NTP pyrophosphatase [bacterium]